MSKKQNKQQTVKPIKSPIQPRVNKTKAQIEAEIKQTQEANRIRGIIKNDIYPLLKDMDESVRYIKIFLHTCSAAVEQAFENKKRETKISELPLMEAFNTDDEKVKNYVKIFELLKNESVVNFNTIVKEMPEQIDQLAYKENNEKKFNEIDVDKMLG